MRGLRNLLIFFVGIIVMMVWYAHISNPIVLRVGMAAAGLMGAAAGIMGYVRPGPMSLRRRRLAFGVQTAVISGLSVCFSLWPSERLVSLGVVVAGFLIWRVGVYGKKFGDRARERHHVNLNR
jgi:hypothetical protein